MPLTQEQEVIIDSVKNLMDIIPTLGALETEVVTKGTDLQFLANLSFVCRKMSEAVDSVRKQIDKLGDKAEQQTCMVLAALELPRTTTEYCTVSPKPSFHVNYPTAPDKEGYHDFVSKLSPDLIRPHYPSLSEAIASAIEKGEQVPFGLEKKGIVSAKMELRITTKKGIL